MAQQATWSDADWESIRAGRDISNDRMELLLKALEAGSQVEARFQDLSHVLGPDEAKQYPLMALLAHKALMKSGQQQQKGLVVVYKRAGMPGGSRALERSSRPAKRARDAAGEAEEERVFPSKGPGNDTTFVGSPAAPPTLAVRRFSYLDASKQELDEALRRQPPFEKTTKDKVAKGLPGTITVRQKDAKHACAARWSQPTAPCHHCCCSGRCASAHACCRCPWRSSAAAASLRLRRMASSGSSSSAIP